MKQPGLGVLLAGTALWFLWRWLLYRQVMEGQWETVRDPDGGIIIRPVPRGTGGGPTTAPLP